MGELSFQEQGSVRYCHGCGADNPRGLQIKSYWDDAEAGTVASVGPAFTFVMHAAFTMIRDRLSA